MDTQQAHAETPKTLEEASKVIERATRQIEADQELIKAVDALLNSTDYCDDNRSLMHDVRAALKAAKEGSNTDGSCSVCGRSAEATVHQVARYQRVPGGYGHPFAAKEGRE